MALVEPAKLGVIALVDVRRAVPGLLAAIESPTAQWADVSGGAQRTDLIRTPQPPMPHSLRRGDGAQQRQFTGACVEPMPGEVEPAAPPAGVAGDAQRFHLAVDGRVDRPDGFQKSSTGQAG